MSKIKQVIIIRKDLNMRKGKMIAQGAHAAMKVFFDRMHFYKKGGDNTTDFWECDFTEDMMEWMNGAFTKVAVGVDSLEDLMYIKGRADEAGIPNSLIKDSGLTEFKKECPSCSGVGKRSEAAPRGSTAMSSTSTCYECQGTGKVNKITVTCIALGPASSDVLDPITGDLKLL